MAHVTETKSEAVKKTATKHKAASEPKGDKKKGKKVVEKPVATDVVSHGKRGVIKGKLPVRAARLGGDVTNAEYAKAHGVTPRMASKIRSGRRKAA